MIRSLYYFVRETFEHTKVLLHNFSNRTRPMTQYLMDTKKDMPLVGVEVGVLYGDNAVNILSNLNITRLYCVDIWEESNVAFFNKLHDYKILRSPFSVAMNNLKNYMDRVVVLRGYSNVVFNQIKSDSLDFVYIDGDHSYVGVKSDLEKYYPLVKKGGVIGGHDFCNYYIPYGSFMGVIRAVTEFCYRNNLEYRVERTDWWIQK